MVTILKPHRHAHADDNINTATEALPDDAADKGGDVKPPRGTELDEGGNDKDGSSSAPGEGPNPTA